MNVDENRCETGRKASKTPRFRGARSDFPSIFHRFPVDFQLVCCISTMLMQVESLDSSSLSSLLGTLPAATAASSEAREAWRPTLQISSAKWRKPGRETLKSVFFDTFRWIWACFWQFSAKFPID